MAEFFDKLETRGIDQRREEQDAELRSILGEMASAPGLAAHLAGADLASVAGGADLHRLPLLRKSELPKLQAANPPYAGFTTVPHTGMRNIFQSPGPIYEPGRNSRDWWRIGRFLHALGIGVGDVVQNCFSYHLTPAGMIFENGAEAVGATVLPAGPGQTALQVRAAVDVGTTAYAGTPDYLMTILEAADEAGHELSITKAAVGGGPLFPELRQAYAERGILCLQNYATADVGNIAYETPALEGMIVDEGVIVEIVRPGTGDPVAPEEVGELVVTSLNRDYPLIRFATGDLTKVLPGQSPCGRTNMRIAGWMGRADQTTKVKGMFVRPEQVAELVASHREITRARIVVERKGNQDVLRVLCETEDGNGPVEKVAETVRSTLKLRGEVEFVGPGKLPNDGKVIDDTRQFG